MSLSRRTFLGATTTAGIVAATGGVAFAAPQQRAAGSALAGQLPVITDSGKLALPRGFKATRVGTIGVEALLDTRNGTAIGTTPSNLDGTGAFDFPGKIRLVRNHECRANSSVPVPLAAGTVYDAGIATGMGGNTVVETDTQGNFLQQWVGLSGTIRNCAGGETPWGSWLSCEEDTTKAGSTVTNRAGESFTTLKDHGYVFEVFPDVAAKQIPEPIKAWGRAVWEGAAIEPSLTKAYITEDTGRGLFYRWTAPDGKKIGPGIARQFGENDGVLQAAKIVRNGTALVHYGQLTADDLNEAYPVEWVDGGEDRQAQAKNLRDQFPGATQHPKIEGCWTDAKGLWIAVSYTNSSQVTSYKASHGIDMDTDSGMIVYYDYAAKTLTLKEHYASGNSLGAVVPGHSTEAIKQFDGPDNITVSPWGTVLITEDGENPCSLVAFSEARGSRELARDIADRGEWAGPAFNKSGSVLFASVQSDCTYAITGPLGQFMAM